MERKLLLYSESLGNIFEPATEGSVGYDLKAKYYVIDWKRNSVVYFTNVRAVISNNNGNDSYIMKIYPRSSVYKKKHIACMVNSVGIIDRDYTGSIKVVFRLQFRSLFERLLAKFGIIKLDIYYPGERIAQLVITKVALFSIEKVRNLSDLYSKVKEMFPNTNRFDKGFGSTGK